MVRPRRTGSWKVHTDPLAAHNVHLWYYKHPNLNCKSAELFLALPLFPPVEISLPSPAHRSSYSPCTIWRGKVDFGTYQFILCTFCRFKFNFFTALATQILNISVNENIGIQIKFFIFNTTTRLWKCNTNPSYIRVNINILNSRGKHFNRFNTN